MRKGRYTLKAGIQQAEAAWDSLHSQGAKCAMSMRDEMRRVLRRDACRIAPFYPIIEAKRGAPF